MWISSGNSIVFVVTLFFNFSSSISFAVLGVLTCLGVEPNLGETKPLFGADQSNILFSLGDFTDIEDGLDDEDDSGIFNILGSPDE